MKQKLTLILLAAALLLAVALTQQQQGRAGDGPSRHSDKSHAAVVAE